MVRVGAALRGGVEEVLPPLAVGEHDGLVVGERLGAGAAPDLGDRAPQVLQRLEAEADLQQRRAAERQAFFRSELAEFTLSPLMDVWYPENPINPA